MGYQLAGALAEYVVLGNEVLDGDEGCYLVPLPDRVGTVEAALVEPWTCVLAAYRIAARTHLRSGGTLRLHGSRISLGWTCPGCASALCRSGSACRCRRWRTTLHRRGRWWQAV